MNMKRNKRGVSLIVLIITIILIIIIAGAIILSLNGSGIIQRAREARFKTDISAFRQQLEMSRYDDELNKINQVREKFNVRRDNYSKDEFIVEMQKIIPSFTGKYANKIEIRNDKLWYIGTEEWERGCLYQITEVAKILKVDYVDENANKMAESYLGVVKGEAIEVNSPYIEGYEPDHYIVEGYDDQDTSITVTYYPESYGLAYMGLDSSGAETEVEANIASYEVTGIGSFTGENLVIPRSYNGKQVTQIKKDAFKNNNTIKMAIIPETVDVVGDSCFQGCSVRYANINAGELKTKVFLYGSIIDIEIGKNVSKIADGFYDSVFGYTGKLGMVKIYSETANFNAAMFYGNSLIESVKVNANNSKYKVEDNVLLSKDGREMYLYPTGKKDEEYVIPSTVEVINSCAIVRNSYIKKLEVPSNVKEIKGERQLTECGYLEYLILNAEKCTFNYADLRKLKKLDIGKNVRNVSGSLLHPAPNLTELNIYTEQATIYTGCFAGSGILKTINVNEDNTKYKVVDNVLFSKDGKTIYMYPQGKEGYYVIPDGVETIYKNAFDGYFYGNNLTGIEVPKTVTNIGASAFYYSKSIENIYYAGTMEEWNAITKGSNWKSQTTLKTITCTDGIINL